MAWAEQRRRTGMRRRLSLERELARWPENFALIYIRE